MAAIFEEVCIHDFDESKLSFDTAKHPKPLTLELIDESDKLLIRSKAVSHDIYMNYVSGRKGTN